MKVTTLLLFACSLQLLATSTKAQSAVINLNENQLSLGQLISEIERQTEYLVVYSAKEIDTNKSVQLKAKSSKVSTYLQEALSNTDVAYEFENDYIILSKKNADLQQSDNKKISGRITDQYGEAIIGASVVVKGSTIGTVTDIDGRFGLDVPADGKLIVSYVGYSSQELATTGKSSLDILLTEDAQALDEVVVIGYGTMKKRDLTGAVSSVKLADAPIQTFSTISHAMAGKAAGLKVTQNSAQVGGGATFNIRGAASIGAGNSPLFIVDGFPISSSSSLESGNRYDAGSTDNVLESINPNDIESIEILKDASSTAIYGSRAGHGVIIITTKRGREGKVTANYSSTVTAQSMRNSYKILGAKDFMLQNNRYYHETWLKENGQGVYADYITPNPNPSPFVPSYTDQQIANARTTDWFDEVTRAGFQQQHNLSLNGGTSTTKYMASMNFTEQKGVVRNNNMERMSVKLNLDQQISKFVKAGLSLNISRNKYDNVPLGGSQWENAGLITSAVSFNPALPIYDQDGNYMLNPQLPQVPNPVSLLEIVDKTNKDRILMSAYIEAELVKNLKLRANFGADRKYQKRKNYLPKSTRYGGSANGSASIYQEDGNDYLMDLTANYTKVIANHNFTALGGYSYQEFSYEGFNAANSDFITDAFLYNNLGAGNYPKPSVGSKAGISSLSSFFSRINYSFMDRYLFTATIRTDGASNFAKGNQWGNFPSLSVGWRFTEESFFKVNPTLLSNGKLRASWGQTGNSNVGNRAIDFYKTAYTTLFGDNAYVGVVASQLGNPNLTWETTTETNIGLDLGFLNNRINIAAEYFDRTISDLLVAEKSLPHYNELNKIAANIGSTRSNGVEITLNTQNIASRNISWNTDFTFSTYNDRWKSRDPNWKPASYQKENDPIRAVFTYRSEGLLQAGEAAPKHQPLLLPGQVKLKDLNGDGKLDNNDVELIGKTDPAFIFGFNNTLKYKSFDFNLYLYGEVNKINSANSYYDAWGSDAHKMQLGENVSTAYINAWSSDNVNTTRPSILGPGSTGDYFRKKISFARVRNITLGYNVPVKKTLLNKVRIYADVNNPIVFTNWNGQDPETDNHNFAYPNVTGFSFGVDVTF
ncbi:SusC/RagA family TonB-linked outer membrane protein [Bacteroidales bacterium]|nr:SusC/RagA family TonB-linked outer membrane protein [Bacteroidales bacterium]